MSEWRQIEMGRAFDVNPPRAVQRGRVTPFIPMDALPEHARSVARIDEREFTGSGTKFQNGDTLVARITPCLENGKTAFIDDLPDGVIAHGRGAVYHLPGELIPTPEDIFGAAPGISVQSSPNLAGRSPNLADRRDADGCLLSDQLSFPIIDDLTILSWTLRLRLEELAREPRAKGKISREKMIEVILGLCERHFVTLRCLAELVRRKPDTLRDQYLSVLVQERKLSLAFPKTPTHERQAYCASPLLTQ